MNDHIQNIMRIQGAMNNPTKECDHEYEREEVTEAGAGVGYYVKFCVICGHPDEDEGPDYD